MTQEPHDQTPAPPAIPKTIAVALEEQPDKAAPTDVKAMETKSPDSPGVGAIDAELLKIESLIATAVRLLDEGRVVELSALQERTKRVCDAAIALPKGEALPLIPAMEALLIGLDALTANLNRRFGDIPNLSSLVGTDTATSAYGQTLKHFP